MSLPPLCLPVSMVILLLGASTAAAQMTVQLPTFRFFTVQTSVSVPDRGSMQLGGVTRAAEGRVSRAVPALGELPGAGRLGRNQAIGRSVSATGIGVSATILDLQEMDEALLGQAGHQEPAGDPRVAGRAAFLAQHLAAPVAQHGPGPAAPQPLGVREIGRRQAQAQAREQQQAEQEAVVFFEKGQKAEAAGKAGVARIFYETAARRAAGPLREQVLARLEAVAGQQAARVARRP